MVQLREVREEDLDVYFQHQQDPEANLMAGIAPRNPQDRGVFDFHWSSLLRDPQAVVRTIEHEGQVAGGIICLEQDDVSELSFWTARQFWSQGVTTAAVDAFLQEYHRRPLVARVAVDNIGPQKILTRRGFAVAGEEQTFSNARAEVVTELIMRLG